MALNPTETQRSHRDTVSASATYRHRFGFFVSRHKADYDTNGRNRYRANTATERRTTVYPLRLLCGSVVLRMLLWFCGSVWAEELRDPFVFGPTYEGSEGQSIREGLTGILWDATNPLAVIDGQAVTVGQTVADWKVVEIKPDRVVIQRDFDRVTLIPGSPWPAD